MNDKLKIKTDEEIINLISGFENTPFIPSVKREIMLAVLNMPVKKKHAYSKFVVPILTAYAIYSVSFLLSLTGNYIFKLLWSRIGAFLTGSFILSARVARYLSAVVSFNPMYIVIGISLSIIAVFSIYEMKILKGGNNEN